MMRDRWQDPNWERPDSDVPGYEWRGSGAATSEGHGPAGGWPGPRWADRSPYPGGPANQTSEPGPSRQWDTRQAPEETSGLDRPPIYRDIGEDDFSPDERREPYLPDRFGAWGPTDPGATEYRRPGYGAPDDRRQRFASDRPGRFGADRYGRPDEWSRPQRSWPNRPSRFEDANSGYAPGPASGGRGYGAGMYWNGTASRDDQDLWRPENDRWDPARWRGSERPDRGGAGGYAGRGPRGYRRSDQRIGEDVNERLTDDDYVDASDISITVEDAVVVLEGAVDSRDAKRRAEDVAASVSGVRDVMNRLDVRESVGGILERIGDALS
jgi:hypothetical protein